MSLNERGIKIPPRKPEGQKEGVIAESFAERLAANPSEKAIFDAKSPSYQKEYNVRIGDAKVDATGEKRIEETLAWIAAGKGWFWKYAKSVGFVSDIRRMRRYGKIHQGRRIGFAAIDIKNTRDYRLREVSRKRGSTLSGAICATAVRPALPLAMQKTPFC